MATMPHGGGTTAVSDSNQPHVLDTWSRRRRPRRAAFARVGALAAAVLVSGGAAVHMTATSSASNDKSANTVRALGGAPGLGPDPGYTLNGSFVGIASNPNADGYWAVGKDGGVFARGAARFYGSAANYHLVGPAVDIASTPAGDGYWIAAADGGVFGFGRAHYWGSAGGYRTNAPITAIAPTPTGQGYWLLGGDGGVFGFGDAKYFGSAATSPHPAPFVAMESSPSGHGYYMLEANGRVFAFGDAQNAGSVVNDGHISLGLALRRGASGYYVARTDGSVRGFGGASSYSAPKDANAHLHPVVAIADRASGGVWLARGFNPPPPPPPPPPAEVDISRDPFLVCTRAHESDTAGGYRAKNPPWYGAYQFAQGTWDSTARHAGRPWLVGVRPDFAAPHDQDVLALDLYHWQGAAPWGNRCAGLP